MIYLDNAATTFPKPDAVYDRVDEYNRKEAVNAGRGAYRASRNASAMIKDVKTELIKMVEGKNKANVIFTPSATVALNQIIYGQKWSEGDNVYVSPYEHNAVLRPLELLSKRKGINVIELPLLDDLSIDIEATFKAFAENKPKMVCLTAISNVTGYILPTKEIFMEARKYKAFTLMDASQAFALLNITMKDSYADAIVFAGHKTLYTTFGIAGFFLRYGAQLEETLTGGNGIKSLSLEMPKYPPDRYEAASMNTPAIAGLQVSLKWLKMVDIKEKEDELMKKLIAGLESVPEIKILKAPDESCQAGVLSINLSDVEAAVLGIVLDKRYDIAVRAGHHCAALIHKHLNCDENRGTVRVSIGAFNTEDDIDALIKALKEIDPEKLRNISPGEATIVC